MNHESQILLVYYQHTISGLDLILGELKTHVFVIFTLCVDSKKILSLYFDTQPL